MDPYGHQPGGRRPGIEFPWRARGGIRGTVSGMPVPVLQTPRLRARAVMVLLQGAGALRRSPPLFYLPGGA